MPLLASGKVLGGFGLTESGAGSDSVSTRAIRERGGYRLNGSKVFITHTGLGRGSHRYRGHRPFQGHLGYLNLRGHEVGHGSQHSSPYRFRPQRHNRISGRSEGREERGPFGVADLRHAGAVRSKAPGVPAGEIPAFGHGHRHRGGAASGVSYRLAEGTRLAVHKGGGYCQALL